MTRLQNCVECGGTLPAGSRIDRRYCRESCRMLAYRRRHPGKNPLRSQRPRRTGDGETSTGRHPGSLANWVARLAADNAVMQTELAVLRARIVEMDSSGRGSSTKSKTLDSTEADALKTAHATIANLEARLQDETRRASQAETAQAESLARLATAEASPHRDQEAGQEQAHKLAQAQDAANRAEHCLQQREVELQRAQTMAQAKAPAMASTPNTPSVNETPPGTGTQNHLLELPWEMPTSAYPHTPRPKWNSFDDSLNNALQQIVKGAYDDFPSVLNEKGQRKLSQQFRRWKAESSQFVKHLFIELCCRIICTDQHERQTAEQIKALADMALSDSNTTLRKLNPGQAEQLNRHVHEHYDEWHRIARYLIAKLAQMHLRYT